MPHKAGEQTPPTGHDAPRAKPASPRKKSFNIATTPREPREGYTAVGRVLRPHALKGELRVTAFSPSARNLQRGRPVYLGGVRRIVMRARPDQEAWILALEGISDRAQVEPLRGELLEAPDAEVLREDDESFFVHELIGLRVVTEDGRDLGVLSEVMQPGGNDVYVVKTERGELLVPAIAEVVKAVSVREGRVVITPLMGMLDDSE